MATGTQVSVTTTATRIIAGVSAETRQATIHVSSEMFLGGSSAVTTANGFAVDKAGGYLSLTINPNEEVWAIVSTGTHTAYVFITEL